MKTRNFSKLVLLSGALAFPSYAEKVNLEQLPSDLQDRIRAEVGNSRIEDIDRQTKDGKTVYEVGYKKDGQHVESRFEHNENTSTAASATSISQKIRYEDLPAAVKRVADGRLEGAEVNDVDRRTKDGRTVYEIGYKHKDGAAQQELLIAEDGRILKEGARNITTSSSTTPPQRPSIWSRGARPQANTPRVQPNASVNTRTMPFSDLPSAVRSAAEARLSDGHVSRVQRMIQNGQVSYELTFGREDGRTQMLVVNEDGRIVKDQILSGSIGSPAVSQSNTDSSSAAEPANTQAAQYAHITTPVQLLNPQQINYSQLPVGVARFVRGYTTQASIDEIRRGSWRGQDAYQIGFTDRNNRYVQLQLDANGQVIYDPRRGNTSSDTGKVINNIGRLFDN
ncbi:MAG: hypothetical protein ACXW3L_03840 [Limisphaerales bacterium]